MTELFKKAFETPDIEEFIELMFPKSWGGVGARILESGATFAAGECVWAPRWSLIPRTVRRGQNELESQAKSCIYRLHDCLHQLWGLPVPSSEFSEADRYIFKRAGMCGEVAVLAITEFAFGEYLYDNFPALRELIWSRNAVPLIKSGGALEFKSLTQVTTRLDSLLHKKLRPLWVRESSVATAFCDDYVPMLEDDRTYLDQHWRAMQENHWRPENIPNSRYSHHLDGLELTLWMIEDFLHLAGTDTHIDEGLMRFNRERRARIELPAEW